MYTFTCVFSIEIQGKDLVPALTLFPKKSVLSKTDTDKTLPSGREYFVFCTGNTGLKFCPRNYPD
jgi:hypothetical protein